MLEFLFKTIAKNSRLNFHQEFYLDRLFYVRGDYSATKFTREKFATKFGEN